MGSKRGLQGFTGQQITNPVKAIRAYCLGCVGGSYTEISRCTIPYCELYPFRFGVNPYRAQRELTDEEKNTLSERLKTAQQDRKNYKPYNGA